MEEGEREVKSRLKDGEVREREEREERDRHEGERGRSERQVERWSRENA